jgi:hypothetical protein
MTTQLQIELTAKTGLAWQTDTPEEYYASVPNKPFVWRYYPHIDTAIIDSLPVREVYQGIVPDSPIGISGDTADRPVIPVRHVRIPESIKVKTVAALAKAIRQYSPRFTKSMSLDTTYIQDVFSRAEKFLPIVKVLKLVYTEESTERPDMRFASTCADSLRLSPFSGNDTRFEMGFEDDRKTQLAQLVAQSIDKLGKNTNLRLSMGTKACIDLRIVGPTHVVLEDLMAFMDTTLGRYFIVRHNDKLQIEAGI